LKFNLIRRYFIRYCFGILPAALFFWRIGRIVDHGSVNSLQLSQVHSTWAFLVFYGRGAEAGVRDPLVTGFVVGNVNRVLFVAWLEDKLLLGIEAAAGNYEYQKEQVDEQNEVQVGAADLGGAIRVRLRDCCHGELLRRLLDVSQPLY